MSFVHLQCHTEYSLLEGALRLKRMVSEACEKGMPAVAITDNGTMFGTIDFYLKAKDAGLNPIVGCDMYLTDDMSIKDRFKYRVLVLCKSYKGYQNLVQLVTDSHLEGFYYRPRIDLERLEKYKEDLIVISPGGRGPVASLLQNYQDEEAQRFAQMMKDMFGDDFYLGIQRLGLSMEDVVIEGSTRIGSELGIGIVATNDVYYHDKESAYLRNVLMCIQTGKRLEDERFRFESDEQYFKSPEEMLELFSDLPEAIENTVKIAEKCSLEIETDQVFLPEVKCPDGKTSEEHLEDLVWEGIKKKYGETTPEIKERVEFELGIINKMHYANYFLIIYDFLFFCEKEGIPVGPGRGSAAGSIVSYAMNITKIDPLKYSLLFERFLNPERVSMPDVDIDFCIRRRGEVIDYISQSWGAERVAQIITFGTMQARAVVRDVGRVLNIPLSDVDKIAKLIPAAPGKYTSIEEALEQVPELKGMYDSSSEFRELLDIGMKLEGQSRHSSTHAAGVVISRDPLSTVVPLVSNDGQAATQYAMADIEKVGLLKMDILGLRNLTVMQDAVEQIRLNYGVQLDLDNLPEGDKKTYELLCSGATIGVFQLESRGMRQLIKDLKPEVFEDIIALLALYRPGPLGSGMVSDFVSNKSGETKVKYELKELEPILKDTYGMIVYQEQVMQIASEIGGFTLGQADMLRRAMGKKKKDVMDAMKEDFLSGAEKKKFPLDKATRIFDLCYKFAEYGFNKSHSAAYALISYQTAYLKANYPHEYMAALLSSVTSVSDKTSLYIQECQDMGLDVLPPSVEESLYDFTVVDHPTLEGDKAIRFGLGAIKNVGEGAIESIIQERKEGAYKSLSDFAMRVDLKQVNKRVFESLIKCGACDCFGDRSQLLSIYERVLDRAQVAIKEQSNGQVGLFGDGVTGNGFSIEDLLSQDFVTLSDQEKLKMEKEMMGLYISGHPLDEYQEILDELTHSAGTLRPEDDGQTVSLGGVLLATRRIMTRTNREMVAGTLEDANGQVSVLAFQGPGFEEIAAKFQDDSIVAVTGKVKYNNDEYTIFASDIQVINKTQMKCVFLDVEHIANHTTLVEIRNIVREFKGPLPLYFRMGEVTIMAHKKYWIADDEECKEKLEALLGPGRLWLS